MNYTTCFGMLRDDGLDIPDDAGVRLTEFTRLVREWNAFASLVSARDLAEVETRHVVDSLSLAPWIAGLAGSESGLLDIGSGGGFPALPVKIVCPGLRVVMVERTAKKVGFLRKVIGALGLDGVDLFHGDFPRGEGTVSARAVTARAVEKPGRVLGAILAAVENGGGFLCQSNVDLSRISDEFHVEHIEDRWTVSGLRRGRLRVVRR